MMGAAGFEAIMLGLFLWLVLAWIFDETWQEAESDKTFDEYDGV